MLRLEMLPAAHGDCLWLEYGQADHVNRILIDGGPASCYETLRMRILALPVEQRHFELLIITHVDADHIEGVIKLLQDEQLKCRFDDIWFNDLHHLNSLPDLPDLPPKLGATQGEFLGALISQDSTQAWNGAFQEKVIVVPQDGELPTFTTQAGLTLTLLSPTRETLIELRGDWEKAVTAAGFTPGDKRAALAQLQAQKRLGPPRQDLLGGSHDVAGEDTSSNNGSSIAVMVEFEDKRLLLSGDAFAQVLESSLHRWLEARSKTHVKLDGFKVPHHGSINNVSEQLLKLIKCKRYFISTSGARFHHPHATAIDMILANHNSRGKPHLYFNYLTDDTMHWQNPIDKAQRKYESHYPQGTEVIFY